MPLTQLDSENADRDLTAIVTVLTHTPSASAALWCQGLVLLGDGAKDLDGTGGNFELTVIVGGRTIQPNPQKVKFDTAISSGAWTTVFPVPANAEVILRIKSPNAADTDVDATAYLYDVGQQQTGDAFALASADVVLDKTTDPAAWRVHFYARGTTNDLIPAKLLKDHMAEAIAAATTPVASQVQP